MKIRPINRFIKSIAVSIAGRISGISLCPFGIYTDYPNDPAIVNHEKIHWRQQVEMLVIPFYLWYVTEYFIKRLTRNKGDAYRAISFEREAYDWQDELNYLQSRRPYAWIRYIFGQHK